MRLSEKPTAVRPFWDRHVPTENGCLAGSKCRQHRLGPTPGMFGLLTTVMKTSMREPIGRRMPARVVRTRSAASVTIPSTSVWVRRDWPLIVPGSGSPMIGWRI